VQGIMTSLKTAEIHDDRFALIMGAVHGLVMCNKWSQSACSLSPNVQHSCTCLSPLPPPPPPKKGGTSTDNNNCLTVIIRI
jgi:hypothetical protein